MRALTSAVSAPEIQIIGLDHVYHKQGDPYVDLGANAKAYLSDGTSIDVFVKNLRNTVPSPCDTVGKYVVEYEAVGPYGFKSRAQRTVEVGSFKMCLEALLALSFHLEQVILLVTSNIVRLQHQRQKLKLLGITTCVTKKIPPLLTLAPRLRHICQTVLRKTYP